MASGDQEVHRELQRRQSLCVTSRAEDTNDERNDIALLGTGVGRSEEETWDIRWSSHSPLSPCAK